MVIRKININYEKYKISFHKIAVLKTFSILSSMVVEFRAKSNPKISNHYYYCEYEYEYEYDYHYEFDNGYDYYDYH